jgi:hypothetical protein
MDAIIPRMDISSKITEKLLAKLDAESWKVLIVSL